MDSRAIFDPLNEQRHAMTPFSATVINKGTFLLVSIGRPIDTHYEETFLTFDKHFSEQKEAENFASSKMVQRIVKIANTTKP